MADMRLTNQKFAIFLLLLGIFSTLLVPLTQTGRIHSKAANSLSSQSRNHFAKISAEKWSETRLHVRRGHRRQQLPTYGIAPVSFVPLRPASILVIPATVSLESILGEPVPLPPA